MPRQNPGRTLNIEASLARRIAWERDNRGWTNEGLARRMADAGCHIQHTAIYKIEKGDPPRRVTVNELVAFARAFDLDVPDLLQPIEAALTGQAQAVFNEWEQAFAQHNATYVRLRRARAALTAILAEHPQTREIVEKAMAASIETQYGYTEPDAVQIAMREFDEDPTEEWDPALIAAEEE
jgi:transcriptional regulator with XRE-family HTH domain